MEEDIKKILLMLEEIKKDLEYLKNIHSDDKKEKKEKNEANRISSKPTTTSYVQIKEKCSWDSTSIDGLIE